jgi:hypothetical protein
MNNADLVEKHGAPLEASTESDSITTSAPDPLS